MTHILETITPSTMTEGSPVVLDCSCGAEVWCADDPDSIVAAFACHIPGEWELVRDNPSNLTGSRLAARTDR